MPTGAPAELIEKVGDVTAPCSSGRALIVHVCNDAAKWGAGVSGAIGARFPFVEPTFRAWAAEPRAGILRPQPVDRGAALATYGMPWASGRYGLGAVLVCCVRPRRPGWWVVNMVAQRGIRRAASDPPALQYDALTRCLQWTGALARRLGADVHCPARMGSDRAGGDWDAVRGMLQALLVDQGVPVTVYRLPESQYVASNPLRSDIAT